MSALFPAGIDVVPRGQVPTPAWPLLYGDGQNGPRVQAIYMWPINGRNRLDDLWTFNGVTLPGETRSFRDVISASCLYIDACFMASAMRQFGGTFRRVRWVTEDNINNAKPTVVAVTGSGNREEAITQLGARTDRLYLAWFDGNLTALPDELGLADDIEDTQPGLTNAANTGPHFAVAGWGDWTGSQRWVPLHELVHLLGAVHAKSPHWSGKNGPHIDVMFDLMQPGTADPSTEAAFLRCSDDPWLRQWCLDCAGDSYFRPWPAAVGSYLASHWNTADSVFLTRSWPDLQGNSDPY